MKFSNVPDCVIDPLCLACQFRNWIWQNKDCMPYCTYANKSVENGKFHALITECKCFKKDKVKYRQLSCL